MSGLTKDSSILVSASTLSQLEYQDIIHHVASGELNYTVHLWENESEKQITS